MVIHFGMPNKTGIAPVCGLGLSPGDQMLNGNHPDAQKALATIISDGSLCSMCKVVIGAYKQGHDDGIEAVTGCSRAERMAIPVPRSRMFH